MPSIQMRILLTISVLVFFFSIYILFIRAPQEENFSIDLEHVSSVLLDSNNKKSLPESVTLKLLVNRISTYESVECGYIGYAGTNSTQFNPTDLLKTLASDSQLVEIINKNNPIVKHFAFLALQAKNSDLSKKVFLYHFKDKQTVAFLCGCIGDHIPINIDFFRSLKTIFTPFEIQYYKNELLKQYSGSYFQHLLN